MIPEQKYNIFYHSKEQSFGDGHKTHYTQLPLWMHDTFRSYFVYTRNC